MNAIVSFTFIAQLCTVRASFARLWVQEQPARVGLSEVEHCVDLQQLIEREGLGDMDGLMSWVGGFSDVHLNVSETVQVIRNSPYLPKLPVHGLVIDINTGELVVVDAAK